LDRKRTQFGVKTEPYSMFTRKEFDDCRCPSTVCRR
jgi:hypothetical protein